MAKLDYQGTMAYSAFNPEIGWLPDTTIDEIVNGQGRPEYNSLRFGMSSVGFSGCGAIAIHNAMILSGHSSNLFDVLDYYEAKGSVRLTGIMPWEIDDYFDDQGISIYGSLSPQIIENTKSGGVAIVTLWNEAPLMPLRPTGSPRVNVLKGAHTVAITYEAGQYQIYNVYSMATDVYPVDSYISYIGRGFIYGYYIPA